MAPKRSSHLHQPPSASSDDEETEEEQEPKTPQQSPDGSESETDQSSSEEQTLNPKSSSVSETPTASDFTIRPSTKPPISKRPFAGTNTGGGKKSKVAKGDEKPSGSKRVWSDDDELVLLRGFIDYQSGKGCLPLSNIDDFHGFIADSLSVNVSNNQLYDKVRRLKKRYRVNAEKGGVNGEAPVFSKPHENKLFEISSKIWGIRAGESVDCNGTSKKPELGPKKEVGEKGERRAKRGDFETLYPNWYDGLKLGGFPKGGISLVKENLGLIGGEKAEEMDEKWKVVLGDEAELRMRRIMLLGSACDVVRASIGK